MGGITHERPPVAAPTSVATGQSGPAGGGLQLFRGARGAGATGQDRWPWPPEGLAASRIGEGGCGGGGGGPGAPGAGAWGLAGGFQWWWRGAAARPGWMVVGPKGGAGTAGPTASDGPLAAAALGGAGLAPARRGMRPGLAGGLGLGRPLSGVAPAGAAGGLFVWLAGQSVECGGATRAPGGQHRPAVATGAGASAAAAGWGVGGG